MMAVLGVIVWIAVNVIALIAGAVGPTIEGRFLHPVSALSFDIARCVGDDAYIFGNLDKRAYSGGVPADLLGLTLFPIDGGDRLAWRRIDPTDKSPESRPSGKQGLGVFVSDGCGVEFTAHTLHESPITGFIIAGKFGPFRPSITE